MPETQNQYTQELQRQQQQLVQQVADQHPVMPSIHHSSGAPLYNGSQQFSSIQPSVPPSMQPYMMNGFTSQVNNVAQSLLREAETNERSITSRESVQKANDVWKSEQMFNTEAIIDAMNDDKKDQYKKMRSNYEVLKKFNIIDDEDFDEIASLNWNTSNIRKILVYLYMSKYSSFLKDDMDNQITIPHMINFIILCDTTNPIVLLNNNFAAVPIIPTSIYRKRRQGTTDKDTMAMAKKGRNVETHPIFQDEAFKQFYNDNKFLFNLGTDVFSKIIPQDFALLEIRNVKFGDIKSYNGGNSGTSLGYRVDFKIPIFIAVSASTARDYPQFHILLDDLFVSVINNFLKCHRSSCQLGKNKAISVYNVHGHLKGGKVQDDSNVLSAINSISIVNNMGYINMKSYASHRIVMPEIIDTNIDDFVSEKKSAAMSDYNKLKNELQDKEANEQEKKFLQSYVDIILEKAASNTK